MFHAELKLQELDSDLFWPSLCCQKSAIWQDDRSLKLCPVIELFLTACYLCLKVLVGLLWRKTQHKWSKFNKENFSGFSLSFQTKEDKLKLWLHPLSHHKAWNVNMKSLIWVAPQRDPSMWWLNMSAMQQHGILISHPGCVAPGGPGRLQKHKQQPGRAESGRVASRAKKINSSAERTECWGSRQILQRGRWRKDEPGVTEDVCKRSQPGSMLSDARDPGWITNLPVH